MYITIIIIVIYKLCMSFHVHATVYSAVHATEVHPHSELYKASGFSRYDSE
jgi:hypothetical protein